MTSLLVLLGWCLIAFGLIYIDSIARRTLSPQDYQKKMGWVAVITIALAILFLVLALIANVTR